MISGHKKSRILIIFFVFLISASFGQTSVRQIKTYNQGPINVGDFCPDVDLGNILNLSLQKGKISDFKGKLLILDFWTTWCAPCINAFPKLDSLQKEFSGKIQILPVTGQPKRDIDPFLQKMFQIKGILMPTVTDDTTLYLKIFPYTYIPHCVWIDKDGKVIAITDGEIVTKENIEKALKGEYANFPLKKDNVKRVDISKKLFHVNYNNTIEEKSNRTVFLDDSLIDYHSILTKYIEGVIGFESVHPIEGRISIVNNPVVNLYNVVLGGFRNSLTNSTADFVIDGVDSSLITSNLQGREYIEWLKKGNGYSYELQVNNSNLKGKIWELALADLNNYFGKVLGIEGKVEMQNRKCLILTRTSDMDKIATKNSTSILKHDRYSLKFQNGYLYYFVQLFKNKYWQNDARMILDETNYKGRSDIELTCDLSDLDAVNKELRKYDLAFVEMNRDVEVMVISKRK